MTQEPTQDDLARLVDREVYLCLSSIVSTLAGTATPERGALGELMEQAGELAAPVLDYEEAAFQAGFIKVGDVITTKEEAGDDQHEWLSWQEACDSAGLDPYEWEVYEHWAVSPWLAEKLQEQGEKVDTDFGNLNVWARTTTGQAIFMDGVIARIWTALHKEDAR